MALVREFEQLWNSDASQPDVFAFVRQHCVTQADQLLTIVLADQQRRWLTDKPLKVEDYLAGLPDLATHTEMVLELTTHEFQCRRSGETWPSIDEYVSRFPAQSDRLQRILSLQVSVGSGDRSPVAAANIDRTLLGPAAVSSSPGDLNETSQSLQRNRSPIEQTSVGMGSSPAQQSLSAANKDQPGLSSTVMYVSSTGIGVQQKGRYRLDRILGEGAFGRVYLGYDEELRRQVAIKVPTKARFQKAQDAETYLAEARTVASLDHPHIVSVHDVGRTEDGSIYVVSKFVEGSTLEDRIRAIISHWSICSMWIMRPKC